GVSISETYSKTNETDPIVFARQIEGEGMDADGTIVAGRELAALNRAVRNLMSAGVPVVCLTTDLPSSRRDVYVGNNQHAAGSVAAMLIGRVLPAEPANNPSMMSVAFRCQQEREMGFRRVLRSDFPHIKADERMISDDRPKYTRDQLVKHFRTHGLPSAVYSAAGANRAVAVALEEFDPERETIFVGHELTNHSPRLLELGTMERPKGKV
ncbi:MAG TPA: substrate-binding domain-containing protein, partial [Paracoccaceae bacterium]|nr:substrate-binding domain-containing protein [Paracoccaceae bacterium]